MSSGRATSIRLSGATTVTLQKPVASAVLTCVTPLVGDVSARPDEVSAASDSRMRMLRAPPYREYA
ncbi:hypothetical protein GCM10010336_00120 [Streptomyces goshikiensis]|nr:hypothetical protein GCM10010336_00120 [Streptomyces goshikiensis]